MHKEYSKMFEDIDYRPIDSYSFNLFQSSFEKRKKGTNKNSK